MKLINHLQKLHQCYRLIEIEIDVANDPKHPTSTRASRVGVNKCYIKLTSLHPDESTNYFPITKDTLQEYIDSKE